MILQSKQDIKRSLSECGYLDLHHISYGRDFYVIKGPCLYH